ncbi:MAG: hypothetical protein ABSB96_01775 [Gaiellaceae bacterium]
MDEVEIGNLGSEREQQHDGDEQRDSHRSSTIELNDAIDAEHYHKSDSAREIRVPLEVDDRRDRDDHR